MILQTNVAKANTEDLDAIFHLMEKQFEDHRIDFNPAELRQAMQEMFVRVGLGFFMVVRSEGQIVGFAAISFAWTLEHCGQAAWLDELYVQPEYRDQGIGSLLLDGVIDEVKRSGCRAIDLEVEADHRRAENLYLRKGFEPHQRNRWVKIL